MPTSRRQKQLTVLTLVALAVVAAFSCQPLLRTIVKAYPTGYRIEGDPSNLTPLFVGGDAQRPRLEVALAKVATGFTQPTAMVFVPGEDDTFVVLEKTGALKWFSLADGGRGTVTTLEVTSASEQGLLGIAFHPRYPEDRRVFLHYTTVKDGAELSRVEAWTVEPGKKVRDAKWTPSKVVLELEQPFANHNGGHLLFGPDGFLYVGFGDGGYRDDPKGNGQDGAALLGKMLRLDVDGAEVARGYAIPKDNPFVGKEGFAPEVWAWGLRNPWRYAFDDAGRLVVADVGQDTYEEVDVLKAGDNAGWNVREAAHCFAPKEGCRTDGLVDPVWEYGRGDGQSITGGVVAHSPRVPVLDGKYLLGDFVSGRLWALELPEAVPGKAAAFSLGKWPMLPVCFARDVRGEVYVVDFGQGIVYRVDPPPPAKAPER